MQIIVNDEKQEVAEGLTLAQLVKELNVPERGTAVALNDKIAKRADWEAIVLNPNDNVLIISAAYGG
ncbi:MAG: sulfur carrier protein ThiS [Bacteroidales bacterium]|nr:sulfur carrier protein ThiS [Bacteroidales bacterium]